MSSRCRSCHPSNREWWWWGRFSLVYVLYYYETKNHQRDGEGWHFLSWKSLCIGQCNRQLSGRIPPAAGHWSNDRFTCVCSWLSPNAIIKIWISTSKVENANQMANFPDNCLWNQRSEMKIERNSTPPRSTTCFISHKMQKSHDWNDFSLFFFWIFYCKKNKIIISSFVPFNWIIKVYKLNLRIKIKFFIL